MRCMIIMGVPEDVPRIVMTYECRCTTCIKIFAAGWVEKPCQVLKTCGTSWDAGNILLSIAGEFNKDLWELTMHAETHGR